MATEIIMKTCRVCKQSKPLSEFYKDNRAKDERQNDCKVCDLKRVKQYYKNNTEKCKATAEHYRQSPHGKVVKKRYQHSPQGKATSNRYSKRYFLRHPEYREACNALGNAIEAGKLPRPNSLQCSCGEQAKQYHHHLGYAPEHWLDVIPVCIDCHTKLRLK